jgi:hypothetical protein
VRIDGSQSRIVLQPGMTAPLIFSIGATDQQLGWLPMHSDSPQFDGLVRYGSEVAAFAVFAICIWALCRLVRFPKRPIWPLVVWPQLAIQGLFFVRDFVYEVVLSWPQS